MNWLKRKYYAFQLYCAAVQLGNRAEAQAQVLYLFGLEK